MYSWLLRNTGMPLVSRVSQSRFWGLYLKMLDFEKLSYQQQRDEQWRRFKKLLGHAYEHVPFHRDRMNAAGITPDDIQTFEDVAKIPPTTKKEIQVNFPDRTSASNLDKSSWTYVSTSGTADRMMAIQDFDKRDQSRAAAMRALRLSGGYHVGNRQAEIPPNICNIVCGDEGQKVEGVLSHVWRMARKKRLRDANAISDLRGLIERNWILNKRTYPPMGMQGTAVEDDKLDEYIVSLRKQKPYVLKALPSYLYLIAKHVEKLGQPPLPVKVVKPMGASVSPRMRRVIEKNFAGEYREDYGSGEFGEMACDSNDRDGLHIFMDLFLIEVVRDGQPVPDGEIGKILITDLSNLAMPFIRYEIGDVGRLSHEPGQRIAPRIFLEGRMQDAIVSEQGDVFTNDRLMDFFYDRDDIEEFQLIEKRSGRYDLMIVPASMTEAPQSPASQSSNPDALPDQADISPLSKPKSNAEKPAAASEALCAATDKPLKHAIDEEQLANDLRAFLRMPKARIRFFPVKTIRPEASGKFRFVQSASYGQLDRLDRANPIDQAAAPPTPIAGSKSDNRRPVSSP